MAGRWQWQCWYREEGEVSGCRDQTLEFLEPVPTGVKPILS